MFLDFIGDTVFGIVMATVTMFILGWVFNQKPEWSFARSALVGFVTAIIITPATKFYWEDQGRNIETVVLIRLFFVVWIALFIGMPLGTYLLKKAAVIEKDNEGLKMLRKAFQFGVLSALTSGISTGVVKNYLENQGYNIETIVYIEMFLLLWLAVVIAMALWTYYLKKTAMDTEEE